MTGEVETTDVAIIGAGPIGLELAVALKQAGVSYVQYDAGPVGSTILWWAPGTRYFSSPERIAIAGVPLVTPDETKATREQYLAYLRGVVRQFDLPVRTYRRVTRIARLEIGFRLTTHPSPHGVGGPEESGEGGRERPTPAAEAALRCYRAGAQVTISYRGDAFDPDRVKYWIRPELEWLIRKERIGWRPHTVPVAIQDDRVVLRGVDGGAEEEEEEEVAADAVLLLTGYVQDPDLFEQLGLELRGPERAPVVDRATMQTSVPGVYVAGTAAGRTQQRARIFIENSHVHVDRITRALTGRGLAWDTDADYATLEEEESGRGQPVQLFEPY